MSRDFARGEAGGRDSADPADRSLGIDWARPHVTMRSRHPSLSNVYLPPGNAKRHRLGMPLPPLENSRVDAAPDHVENFDRVQCLQGRVSCAPAGGPLSIAFFSD